jgi:hypothetical protein
MTRNIFFTFSLSGASAFSRNFCREFRSFCCVFNNLVVYLSESCCVLRILSRAAKPSWTDGQTEVINRRKPDFHKEGCSFKKERLIEIMEQTPKKLNIIAAQKRHVLPFSNSNSSGVGTGTERPILSKQARWINNDVARYKKEPFR